LTVALEEEMPEKEPPQLTWNEIKYSAQDFIDAQRLHCEPRIRDWIVIALITIPIGFFIANDPDNSIWGLFPIAVIALWAVIRWLYAPWMANRNYRMQPLAQIHQSFALHPDGLEIRNARGEGKYLWTDFIYWRANKSSVLLYISPMIYLVLPMRLGALGFPIEELKAHLTEKIGSNRK
jgi:hypothetical protein